MEYNSGHTARFLVSFFLNRKDSLKYNLNGSHRGILRYLADAIDLEFYKRGKRIVSLNLNQIATYSGFSVSTTKRAIIYLIKKRLLQKSHVIGYRATYQLGIVPALYALKKDKISTTEVKSWVHPGHSDLASNTLDSKLQTYNKEIPFLKEKIKSKSVLQKDSREHQKAALEIMRIRLKKDGKIS